MNFCDYTPFRLQPTKLCLMFEQFYLLSEAFVFIPVLYFIILCSSNNSSTRETALSVSMCINLYSFKRQIEWYIEIILF